MSYSVSTKPLVGEYKFILESDPAIDRDAAEWAEGYRLYLETGKEEHLKLKPGQEPTRWELRTLNPKQYRILHSIQSPLWAMEEFVREHSMPVVMFEYCKAGLIGWDLQTDEGGDVPFTTTYDKDQDAHVCSKEVIQVLHNIGPSLPVEIGFAVWRRTYLSPLPLKD